MGKVVSGARAKVAIVDPTTGLPKVLGIFNQVSYDFGYGAQDVYILGRTGPAEIEYTHQEPVTLRLNAWRTLDHGPFAIDGGHLPHLQDVLTSEYVEITLIDRQREKQGSDGRFAIVRRFRLLTFSTTINNRQLAEYSVTGRGIIYEDEAGANTEDETATDLP